MNFSQKQYELSRCLFSTDLSDPNNYFTSLNLAKARKNPYSSPKKFIIKHVSTEPFKDFYVIKENKKIKIRLDSISNKPVEPILNNEYIELEERIKINKDKYREIYKRGLSRDNEKYSSRIFSQKPRIISTELLEKLYIETHEKYIEQMKGKNTARNKGKEKSGKLYGKIVLPKISGYKDWNMDSNENIKSKEVKNHGHKEITHQKPGHADNDENMDSNEKIKEDENNQNEREAIAS
jgi:hypothetical protein